MWYDSKTIEEEFSEKWKVWYSWAARGGNESWPHTLNYSPCLRSGGIKNFTTINIFSHLSTSQTVWRPYWIGKRQEGIWMETSIVWRYLLSFCSSGGLIFGRSIVLDIAKKNENENIFSSVWIGWIANYQNVNCNVCVAVCLTPRPEIAEVWKYF